MRLPQDDGVLLRAQDVGAVGVGRLRPEIIAVKNAISEDELYGLGDLAVDRLKRVTKGILQVGGPFWVAGKRRIFSVQRKNTRRASDVCE